MATKRCARWDNMSVPRRIAVMLAVSLVVSLTVWMLTDLAERRGESTSDT